MKKRKKKKSHASSDPTIQHFFFIYLFPFATSKTIQVFLFLILLSSKDKEKNNVELHHELSSFPRKKPSWIHLLSMLSFFFSSFSWPEREIFACWFFITCVIFSFFFRIHPLAGGSAGHALKLLKSTLETPATKNPWSIFFLFFELSFDRFFFIVLCNVFLYDFCWNLKMGRGKIENLQIH